MRNAAGVLGLIAGAIGIFVGLFGYGVVELQNRVPEADLGLFERPGFVQFVSFVAPLLCIAGGAMAHARALIGGVLLLISAAGMYYAFGFNVFTMFPIAFAGVAGVIGLAAGKPDKPKSHF